MKTLVFIFCLAMLQAVYAESTDEDEGWAAFQRGDYTAALKAWLPYAENGDPGIQGNIAYLYSSGLGVPQDFGEALKWNLRAAEQGYHSAQHAVGQAYATGEGVPQDYYEAANWHLKAALQGYASSQFNLGIYYFEGMGVKQDIVQSYMWFDLAIVGYEQKIAEGFDMGAYRQDSLKARNMVRGMMTIKQIEEAQRLVRVWRPKPMFTY